LVSDDEVPRGSERAHMEEGEGEGQEEAGVQQVNVIFPGDTDNLESVLIIPDYYPDSPSDNIAAPEEEDPLALPDLELKFEIDEIDEEEQCGSRTVMERDLRTRR
jgi:hypothetical protein